MTPEARAKTMRWLMSVVFPALDPTYKVRINGTNCSIPESMIVQISRDKGWVHRRFPWVHRDPQTDEATATWPDRFPLDKIAEVEASYQRLGLSTNYKQEYMCEAEDPAVKAFTSDMFKVEPTVRTWHATYSMYDPARTVKDDIGDNLEWCALFMDQQSADYLGCVRAEVEARRDASSRYVPCGRPLCARYYIGVERDGLEEFIPAAAAP